MRIQLLSDLHIEFADHNYTEVDCDVVVLAGDIHVKDHGLQWARDNIKAKPVIYVLGNHEFYGKTFQKHIKALKEASAGTNIYVLEQDSVTIDGVNFLGCTLWTNFELFGDARIAGYECQQVMTDYKKIKKLPGYSKIRSIDTAIFHKQSLSWLDEQLQRKRGQNNVVITHHGPSIQSVEECYHDDITTAAYVSPLDEFVLKHSPCLWLHGHLHNSSDYLLGNTRVLCNPKGYPGEENDDFNELLTVNI